MRARYPEPAAKLSIRLRDRRNRNKVIRLRDRRFRGEIIRLRDRRFRTEVNNKTGTRHQIKLLSHTRAQPCVRGPPWPQLATMVKYTETGFSLLVPFRTGHMCVHTFFTQSVYNILTGIFVDKAIERVLPEREQVVLVSTGRYARMQ